MDIAKTTGNGEGTRQKIASALSGATLLLAFVMAFTAVVFTIAALQFKDTIPQTNIGNVTASGKESSQEFKATLGIVHIGVSTLEGYYAEENDLDSRQNSLKDDLSKEDQDWDDITAKLSAVSQDVGIIVNSRRGNLANPVLSAVPFQPPDNAYYLRSSVVSYIASIEQKGEEIALTGQRIDTKALHDVLNKTNDMVNQRLAGFADLLRQNTQASAKEHAIKAKLADVQQRFAKLSVKYFNSGNHLNSESFRNLCEELLAYKSLLGRFAYTLIFAPRSSLVLFLSVVMGIFGSIIYLARMLVIENKPVRFWPMLFRASLGGAIALAIYVFAAAGLVAFGQSPGTLEARSDLSPYFISFLGITAGYLSDHMTRWMAEVGRKTFKFDEHDGTARWAIRLAEELKKQDLSSDRLASVLNIGAADVADIVSLKRSADPEQQALIAAFVRVHPSILFTDLAPG